ncbi:zinc metalloprotease [Pelomyxa schiedti]|nr:zinc metalloprotease [Pelomyxa schiedti]
MGNTPQSSSLANSPVLGAETVNCSSEEFRRRLCDDEGFTSGDHDQIGPSSCTGGGGGGGGGTKDGAPGKAASGWAMPWANAGRGRKVKRAVAPLKTLVVTCEGVNEEVALPKVFALFNVVALQRHLDIGSLVVKSVISVVILIFVEDPHYEISVILPPQTQNKLRSEWELCDELIVGPRGIAMSLSSDGATPDQCRVCGDFLSKLFSNPNNSMESSKQEDKSIPKYLQNVHKLKSLQHCCGSSAHEILSPVRGDAFAAPQIEFRDGSTASINLFQCIDNPDRCLTIYHHDIFIPLLRHDGGASDPTLTYAAGSRLLGEKWEGGIVPYRIFPNISQYHMVELRSTILLYDLAYAKNKKAGLKRILDQAPVGMGLLQKINQAIVSIQEVCPVRFVLASDESPNCVIILHDKAGPWSQTGKAPTPIQRVALHNNVTVGNIIHELLHTLGLDHTHCRYDRDKYVNVNYEFIDKSNLGDFDKSVNEKEAVGSYDFGSIMHYPRNAFSTSSKPTLEPIPGGVEIGQRKCLSPGDIHTVQRTLFSNLGLVV